MTVEQQLCKRLADILKELLPDVDVEGNFLPDETDTFKGMDIYRGGRLDVVVGTRKYESYTSLTAEMDVALEGEFPVAEDADLTASLETYERIVGLLETWHGDVAAVKSALTIDGVFGPVGLRLSGGVFELDRETKTRVLSQTFTLRGRMSGRF